jgi:hypothetical protein
LGLELGKTIKLEWHKAANTRLRCLRITSKEEKAVRKQLGVRRLAAREICCNLPQHVDERHSMWLSASTAKPYYQPSSSHLKQNGLTTAACSC